MDTCCPALHPARSVTEGGFDVTRHTRLRIRCDPVPDDSRVGLSRTFTTPCRPAPRQELSPADSVRVEGDGVKDATARVTALEPTSVVVSLEFVERLTPRRGCWREPATVKTSCRCGLIGVPPRRRRDGYRPGRLSPALAEAIEAEAESLSQIDGPVATIEAVGNTFAALDDALAEIAVVRLRAVAHLRGEGWSYSRIAQASGLTKQRVAQLAREATDRGLLP